MNFHFFLFIIKLNPIDYYLEEIINFDKENKLYFVFDTLFNEEGIYVDDNDYLVCKRIQNILKLDVMSIGICYTDGKKYIIDVNTSPAFFKSESARIAFIEKVLKQ